jgi:hypothetical protein
MIMVVKITEPLKLFNELLNAVIDSKSKWFVGSSIINTPRFPSSF